jgi:hypothetical protein
VVLARPYAGADIPDENRYFLSGSLLERGDMAIDAGVEYDATGSNVGT